MGNKQYIYIGYYLSNTSVVKIGGTDDPPKRLYQYNHSTGHSRGDRFVYIFLCEVSEQYENIETDTRRNFAQLLETGSRETYLHNDNLFNDYVGFIKKHKSFVKEIFIKPEDKKQIIKIVKKTMPTLQERGLSKKDVMQRAQKAKNDEFYTRYEDIEKEISMYPKSVWKNKVIFCNCDDAVGETRTDKDSSAFALYFIKNFQEFGLKKLICTHFGGALDLFNAGAKGYIFTKDGFREITEIPKGFTGSFDDPLSLQILQDEADIVCTNPPFSRARDYWKIIIDSGKKFLIISNETNVKNDAYIPYVINGQVWPGYNDLRWFLTPKRELTRAAAFWFTNFKIKDRPKYKNLKMIPLKEIPEKYKKFDDEKTLLVDYCYIPSDYDKPFAVSTTPILSGLLEKGYRIVQEKQYRPYINGREVFARVLVQKI